MRRTVRALSTTTAVASTATRNAIGIDTAAFVNSCCENSPDFSMIARAWAVVGGVAPGR